MFMEVLVHVIFTGLDTLVSERVTEQLSGKFNVPFPETCQIISAVEDAFEAEINKSCILDTEHQENLQKAIKIWNEICNIKNI